MPAAPIDETESPREVGAPVFVDVSGRRLRRSRVVVAAVLGMLLLYVALVVSAFFGGPRIAGPLLPLGSAAGGHAADAHKAAPPVAAPAPSSPTPATPVQKTAPVQKVVADPNAVPAVAVATPAPAPAAPTPTPSPTATGSGKSATAPGQSRKPPHP